MITGNYKITGMAKEGYNILGAKLNGVEVYKVADESPYYIEYTVDNSYSNALNSGSGTTFKYGLPRIYHTNKSSYIYPDDATAASLGISVEITLLSDGSKTTDMSTPCNNVAKIKIIYPESTVAVKFSGSYNPYCPRVKNINYINTSNFTDMSRMFYYCTSLTSLDLSNWDTSKVTGMFGMFYECTSLTSLDVSSFNTSKVTDMGYMFWKCQSLTSLDLSNFDTSKVTTTYYMFRDCTSLTSLDLSNFDTSKVTVMNDMFSSIPSTVDWHYDGSNYQNFTLTESQTYFSGTFPWNFYIQYTVASRSESVIDGAIPKIYEGTTLTSYTKIELKDSSGAIIDSSDLEVPLSTVGSIKLWYSPDTTRISFKSKYIKTVDYAVTDNFTSMESMFAECNSLTSLDLSNFNTSNVTNMKDMFRFCTLLTSLDLSSFNTSNVTNMREMFSYCWSLTSLDLSNFNTSKVTDMNSMFCRCGSLTSLNLSNFDTSKVTYEDNMFYDIPEVMWCYDGTNYQNFTLNSWYTSYLNGEGTFPWERSTPSTYTIDYTATATEPSYPSWYTRTDSDEELYFYFEATSTTSGRLYSGATFGDSKNNGKSCEAVYQIKPIKNMVLKISGYTRTDGYDYLYFTYKESADTGRVTIGNYSGGSSGNATQFTTKGMNLLKDKTYELRMVYKKDSSDDDWSYGVYITKLVFYYQ